MVRYRFRWENLPPYLLTALGDELGVPRQAAVERLRARYGARPREQFVGDFWPVLRDVWLNQDDDAAREVARSLQARGLGEVGFDVGDQDQCSGYLRSVRNSQGLRSTVLTVLHQAGEVAGVDEEPTTTGPSAPGMSPASASAVAGQREETTAGHADLSDMPLHEHVRRFIAARMACAPSEVEVDRDGDVPFRSGSAAFFVRAVEEPPLVLIFAPLLSHVEPSPALLLRLNELSQGPLLTFTEDCGTVFARIRLIGRPFVGEHLDTAIGVMFGVLDQVDDVLQQQFGGSRFFDERPKPPPIPQDVGSGGYL